MNFCDDPECVSCRLRRAVESGDTVIPITSYAQLDAILKQMKPVMDSKCMCPACVAMRKQVLSAGANAVKLEARNECMPQVDALMGAGWLFELPAIQDPEPWQWYWRRPSKVKGKKGRLFMSTNQAYNALMRGTP